MDRSIQGFRKLDYSVIVIFCLNLNFYFNLLKLTRTKNGSTFHDFAMSDLLYTVQLCRPYPKGANLWALHMLEQPRASIPGWDD